MTTARCTARVVAVLLVIAAAPVAALADKPSKKLESYRQSVETATGEALAWLAREQLPAGNFPGQYGKTNGVVALCAMAFMCKGYTPGYGPYGQTINRCIDYVLSGAAGNGYMGTRGGAMYSHCIATLMLCEVSGMVDSERQKKIDVVLSKAIQVILGAQHVSKSYRFRGGWRYSPNSRDSDLSVSGWAIMALRSARLNGAPVPGQAIGAAMMFVGHCYNRDAKRGLGFGYQPSHKWSGVFPSVPMSGVGLLCHELTGRHNSGAARQAANYILRYCKNGQLKLGPAKHWHYALYYCAQGMFQIGGAYWERFAASMYKYLLRRHRANGSFGSPYQTAMTVLALGVTYRQLPIYQR